MLKLLLLKDDGASWGAFFCFCCRYLWGCTWWLFSSSCLFLHTRPFSGMFISLWLCSLSSLFYWFCLFCAFGVALNVLEWSFECIHCWFQTFPLHFKFLTGTSSLLPHRERHVWALSPGVSVVLRVQSGTALSFVLNILCAWEEITFH